jgi:lipid-binding SYLF domain-containing protein
MRAEMLSYSRSRGVFAGVSLKGATLRPDEGANDRLYGKGVTAAQIVEESRVRLPDEARALVSRLQKASPRLQQ